MKKNRGLFIVSALILAAAPSFAAKLSKDDIRKIITDNPDIVIDVFKKHPDALIGILKDNKEAFFKIVTEAAQEEQAKQQKASEEAEKKEFEDSFKNPKTAKIDDNSMVRGDTGAKYTLVEYSDFQCPYCGMGYKTVEELRKKYGASLRFIFKNKPLPMHPQAMPAARYFSAIALQSKDKAWQFHDKMFQNQDKLSEAFMKETAKALAVDMAKLEKDVAGKEVQDRIDGDMAEAEKFGFQGTPGFLLNGVPVRGAYPLSYFENIIQRIDGKDQKN